MFKSNEYFDGHVKSLAFQTATLPATIGIMAKGDYTFNTNDKETMTVVSGAMAIKMPGASEERTYKAGESFEVPADSSFEVRVTGDTAYLCLYG